MPHEDAPGFMKALSVLPATLGRDALQLTILPAVRSHESRKVVCGEFDLDKGTWSIPASQMKTMEAHVVPLAPAAVKLVRALRPRQLDLHGAVRPEGLLFSARRDKAISDMTMLKILRDVKVDNATVPGFRSTFTD